MNTAIASKRVTLILVLVGISLFGINQKVDYDGADINYFALFTRSTTWFLMAILISIFNKIPNTANFDKYAKRQLIFLPIIYLMVCFFSSLISYINYGVFIDLIGFSNFILLLLSMLISLIIYVHGTYYKKISLIKFFIKWSTVPNILAFFMIYFLGIINISIIGHEISFMSDGDRFQGFSLNPNIIATQFCIAIGLALSDIFIGSRWNRLVNLIFIAVSLLVIASTGVRAAWLSVVAMLFLMAKFRLRRQNFFQVVAALFFLSLVLWFSKDSVIFNTFFERLNNSDDGRLFLWNYYFDKSINNPFGYGFGFEEILGANSIIDGIRLPPHNAFLTASLYAGWAGFVIVIFRVFSILKFSFHKIDNNTLGFLLASTGMIVNLFFFGDLMADLSFGILFGAFCCAVNAGPSLSESKK